jgi:PAS domain S-box-containing protein/putative nucleotidyltransferase with HDIG domain
MSEKPQAAPPRKLWYLGESVKYFFIIFLSLVIVVALILALLYYRWSSLAPSGVLEAVAGGVVSTLLLVVLGILFVSAAIGAWFLVHAGAKRKRLEDQLEFDAHLFDAANDAIMVHDLDGNCIYANEAAYRSHGYGKEELMDINLYQLNAPEYANIIETKTNRLLEEGEVTFESTHILKDKSLMPVEVHSRLIKSGGQTLILSSVRDITERKRTEEELKQSAEKLRKAMEGTIQTIALTTEMKDPYTAGHQHRVAKLASAVATELGLSQEQIEGLRVAGSLHDIGKIYVPAEILAKPGHLRQNELNLVKDHAQVGYDLLKTVEFPWPVAQIVLQHHERIDGSGYPLGLKGEEILIEAKILGVADVVEAMSSHRPYRPAFSLEKALLEIIHKKGALYPPEVVDACVTVFNDKGFNFD